MYYIDSIIIIEYLKVIPIIDMKQIDIEMSKVIHNLTSGLIYLDDCPTPPSASGRGKNNKNVPLWMREGKTHGRLFLALGLDILLNFGKLYLSLGMKVLQIFEYGEEIMDLHMLYNIWNII